MTARDKIDKNSYDRQRTVSKQVGQQSIYFESTESGANKGKTKVIASHTSTDFNKNNMNLDITDQQELYQNDTIQSSNLRQPLVSKKAPANVGMIYKDPNHPSVVKMHNSSNGTTPLGINPNLVSVNEKSDAQIF